MCRDLGKHVMRVNGLEVARKSGEYANLLTSVLVWLRRATPALVFLLFAHSALGSVSLVQDQTDAEVSADTRQQALIELQDVAERLKSYDDVLARIRLRTMLADALWPADPDLAKGVLSAAFADIRELKKPSVDLYKLRLAVIQVARRHDPSFAAKLIAQVSVSGSESGGASFSRDSFESISQRGALYVDSAANLLNQGGDPSAAVQMAKSSLAEGRSAALINFLVSLRERDARAADQLFLDALAIIDGRPDADPNDVMLMGFYVFSPHQLSVGSINGQVIIGMNADFAGAQPVSTALVLPYLSFAADVMTRFQVPVVQPSSEGLAELKAIAIQRLLPLFDRYDQAQSPSLRAALEGLAGIVPSGSAAQSPAPQEPLSPSADGIQNAAEMPPSPERDAFFAQAAFSALGANDLPSAAKLASKVSDSGLKAQLAEMVAFKTAISQIEKGDLDGAEKTAAQSGAELHALLLYRLSIAWLKRNDTVMASEEADAAVAVAGKVDDPAQRARIYVYMASG